MCPSQEILSIYFDGELPSPWKEKIVSHTAVCPKCQAALGRFERGRALLRDDASSMDGEAAAFERVGERLALARRSASIHLPRNSEYKWDFRGQSIWRRRVTLSLPALAGVSAAAAALVFVAGFALFRFAGPVNNTMASQSAQSVVAEDIPIIPGVPAGLKPASNLREVLKYLDTNDKGDYVILRIPEKREFRTWSKPRFITDAEYNLEGSGK
jgi:hypothetical protein